MHFLCSAPLTPITRVASGTRFEPGKNSPFRERSVEENLKLFAEMADGKLGQIELKSCEGK